MKTLHKLLSLTIAFSLLCTALASAAYKDVDYEDDYASAVELLTELEIFEGDEKGNFNPDSTITRAEMAAIVCRAKGLESAAKGAKGVTPFNDVSASHWASGYINLASQNGIINGYGDGNFGPEDTVTYNQAVKMLVCALGFEPMASAKGGWPTGYLVVANTYKINEGASNTALRKNIATLVYNALSTPMMDQTSYGANAEYQVLDGRGGRDYKTVLSEMDIYIATGVVGSKSYDEIEFDVTIDSDDGEFDEGDTESFVINGSDIANYQHQNVDVYVKKTSRKAYKVISVAAGVEGASLTIISDDIKEYANNKLTYYISSSNSKTKTLKIKAEPLVELNMSEYDGSLTDLLDEEDIELKFIENTGDSTYDAIIATKYISTRVEYVDASRDKIMLQGRTITLNFDDEDVTTILEDDRGNPLELDDFKEDDVVAVVSDNENFKNYIDYIRIIKLRNAVVRGSVDSAFTSNGNRYVVIDDEEFIDSTGKTLSVGDEGIFFVGMTGKIIDFDGSSVGKDYAYVLEAALAKDPFSTGKWMVKLLTMDDGIVTYTLTDAANDYFVSTYAEKIGINTATDESQLYANLTNSEKADPDRLVTFKTNAKGYIKSIESAYKEGTSVADISASRDEYNDRTQIIGGRILEDDAVVFNLISQNAENTYATDISYLVDEGKYSGFVFADTDYENSVMVVTQGESDFAEEIGFAIVTKVATINDADKNSITKVTFVQNEKEGTLYFDSESDNKAGAYDAYEDLELGDVFAYNANSKGYVSEYVVIGSISGGLLRLNTPALNMFGADTEFVYGYIANSSPRNISKGETLTINNGKKDRVITITRDTYKYTYDDSGRSPVIETEDFLAGDAYYYDDETGEATYVLVKLVDGFVVDIYSFGKRVVIGGAQKVELAIDSIGVVSYTEASYAKITAAKAAYNALTEEEKEKVTNYSVLEDAIETYTALLNADKASKVKALIEEIGTVDATDACAEKIALAENAYAGLTTEQKELVDNYSVLTEARSAYNALVANAKVDAVKTAISQIGTVENTPECKAKIDSAKAMYDALSDGEKALVTNYNDLETAISAYNSLIAQPEPQTQE